MDYEGRLSKLARALEQREVDCLLVSEAANLRYLTGFSGSSGIALIWAAAAAGGREHLFISDFRYEEQAASEVHGAYRRIFISAAGPRREAFELLAAELPAAGGAVAFQPAHLSVAALRRLEEHLPPSWRAQPLEEDPVESLREVKDREEIERIAQASALADAALSAELEVGLQGRSERELVIALEHRMRLLGAQDASFPTIVASGAHGSLPHAQARDEPIARGSLVTIDWGALHEGYCSDCTRTFAVGTPSERAREIYALVLAAQQAALEGCRSGLCGYEVDALARDLIAAAGYGERFGHGLGHGVGLEVHEAPRLGPRSAARAEEAPARGTARIACAADARAASARAQAEDRSERPLQAGAVVTIEPGIYIAGELGVRIEELVVLHETGKRVLTTLPRELIEL
jgi:Xaa-Pro aminopeptidase